VCTRKYIWILVFVSYQLHSQVDSVSTFQVPETTASDTIPTSPMTNPKSETVEFSESGLDTEILYGGDNQVYEHKNNVMHLYGNAYVTYQDKELKSDYIQLDLTNNIAEARISEDIKNATKPTFKDGDKTYNYNGLRYNFKKEKGIVYDAISQEGEFLIHGQKTKYVSGGDNIYSDDDVIYNANSLITTCNHDHPHFGFRAKKLKLIPDKIAVVGPANLEIGGVPTPIVLPFGFFPLVEGKSSGFIFPQNYEFNSRELGFGLRGLGWYFPINDYVHVRLTGDIYTRGSHGIRLSTNYKKRYKYTGKLDLSYDFRKTEIATDVEPLRQRGFSIILDHSQDAKAHPFINVGGRINIIGNNNENRVRNVQFLF